MVLLNFFGVRVHNPGSAQGLELPPQQQSGHSKCLFAKQTTMIDR